jgi:flagellar biosynthesis/type III secretory pathway M-ring protein FliF/YscJ
MGSFHLWSIVATIKETITDVRKRYIALSVSERKKFLLRGLLALVVFVILFAFLWMHGHNLI